MKKKSRIKRTLKYIILSLTGIIILLLAVTGVVLHVILTPEKITPILLDMANDYLEAEVECESVEITFFKTFPNLGLSLDNGCVIIYPDTIPIDSTNTYDNKIVPDTLVSFHNCLVSCNPIAFIFDKKVLIEKLELNNPKIFAYVDKHGKANWDIIPSDQSDTIKTQEGELFQLPELNLKRLKISDASIIYDNREDDTFILLDSMQLSLKGNMSADSSFLDLNMGMKTLTAFVGGQSAVKDLPLGVQAQLMSNRRDHRIDINKALISLGILELDAKGSLQKPARDKLSIVDIDFNINASSLPELLKMIPENITDISKKIKSEGDLSSFGKFKGELGPGVYPVLTFSLQLKDGLLRSAKQPDKSGLEKIEINFDAQIDFTNEQPSFLNVNHLFIQSASSKLECSGSCEDIFTKPLISANVIANINFNRLSQDLPNANKNLVMGGSIQTNLKSKFYLDDLLNANYGKINANGYIEIDDVTFKDPEENIDLFSTLTKINLGSNVKDSIRGKERESLLRADIALDSININWKNEIRANTSKLFVRFRTEEPADTSSIALISAGGRMDGIHLMLSDSIRVRAAKSSIFFRLNSSPENKKKPELISRFTMDSLRYRLPVAGGRISRAELTLRAKPEERIAGSRTRRQLSSTDSIARSRMLDSLRNTNRDTYLSFRLESNEARSLIRDWNISGSFDCNNAGCRTPYFPIPMQIPKASFKFTTNTLTLENTHLKAGSSDMKLNGEIEGIRRALLRNGQIQAKINLTADSLNFNEIVRTFIAGTDYSGKNVQEKDSVASIVLNETIELASADTTKTGVFIIPPNIDMELNTDMKNVKYNNIELKRSIGKITIRNQAVRLTSMDLDSNVGDAVLSLFYKAPDKKGADLGMDLEMNSIQVGELLSAFPIIDTLAPMLRSFDGVVDCKITALTSLDSTSGIIFPETTASCYLSGSNMILMDGETFAEISKMLMFKNKKRNLIDSISAEMILEDSKIMVFPFKVTIDRYTAGVGGTQNLDLSFNYHISVLKSPLPFKIGLNLTGTPDKMKIRLAKPKYKDLFTPAKEKSLEETQVNLRIQMQEKLLKSINEIMNESSPSIRRPQIAMNDSIRRIFFELDTTKYEVEQDSLPVGKSSEELSIKSDSYELQINPI